MKTMFCKGRDEGERKGMYLVLKRRRCIGWPLFTLFKKRHGISPAGLVVYVVDQSTVLGNGVQYISTIII